MIKSKFNIKIDIIPLNSDIEEYICSNLNLNPYKSYSKMSEEKIDHIYKKILNEFNNTNITIPEYFCEGIILSIRANLMREHIIKRHKKILALKYDIINDYKNGIGILKLSTKYDGSPLNLLRIIFDDKYKKKLTQIINNKNILTKRDNNELDTAISNDLYALINQTEVLKKSSDFEFLIQKLLNSMGIKYKTQEQLAREQIKKSNIATNTPDFLILDDLIINGVKINWIDAKNFFGLDTSYIKKRIKHQTKKYLDAWGTGAIIFNLGFGSKLKINGILFIDFYSFNQNFIKKNLLLNIV